MVSFILFCFLGRYVIIFLDGVQIHNIGHMDGGSIEDYERWRKRQSSAVLQAAWMG